MISKKIFFIAFLSLLFSSVISQKINAQFDTQQGVNCTQNEYILRSLLTPITALADNHSGLLFFSALNAGSLLQNNHPTLQLIGLLSAATFFIARNHLNDGIIGKAKEGIKEIIDTVCGENKKTYCEADTTRFITSTMITAASAAMLFQKTTPITTAILLYSLGIYGSKMVHSLLFEENIYQNLDIWGKSRYKELQTFGEKTIKQHIPVLIEYLKMLDNVLHKTRTKNKTQA